MITRRQFLIGVAASATLVAVPTIAIPPSWIGHLDEPVTGRTMPIRLLDGETIMGTGAATSTDGQSWVTTFVPGAATGLITTIEYDHGGQSHRYEIPGGAVHLLSSDSFEVTIKLGQTLSQ